MALEENRQEENDLWPVEYIEMDVEIWVELLKRRVGGESSLLEIGVMRRDRHLRECLRLFEKREGSDFARQALDKSKNLVVISSKLPFLGQEEKH
jgi:hypothetical protein